MPPICGRPRPALAPAAGRPEDRAALSGARVTLTYRRMDDVQEVNLHVNLGVELERVGGETFPFATLSTLLSLQ
jgi:hypothetical protein